MNTILANAKIMITVASLLVVSTIACRPAGAPSSPGGDVTVTPNYHEGVSNDLLDDVIDCEDFILFSPVGSAAGCGSWHVKVNDIFQYRGNEWSYPQPGFKYVVVDVTVTNISNDTVALEGDEFFFEVTGKYNFFDPDGELEEFTYGAYPRFPPSPELLEPTCTYAPGQSVRGWYTFEVLEGADLLFAFSAIRYPEGEGVLFWNEIPAITEMDVRGGTGVNAVPAGLDQETNCDRNEVGAEDRFIIPETGPNSGTPIPQIYIDEEGWIIINYNGDNEDGEQVTPEAGSEN